MSFFEALLGKKDEKKDKKAVIPEHVRKQLMEIKEEQERLEAEKAEKPLDSNTFMLAKNIVEVQGIFGLKTSLAVVGFVKAGKVTKGQRLDLGNKKIKVVSVEVKGRKVKEAQKGEKVLLTFNENASLSIGSTIELI